MVDEDPENLADEDRDGRADGQPEGEADEGPEKLPEPARFDNTGAVVLWACVTGFLLVALAAVGLRLVAGLVGSAFLVLGALLIGFNWGRTTRDWTGRGKWARRSVVAVFPFAAALPWVALAVAALAGLRHPHGGKIWVPRAALLTAAVATASICLSGLVDWSYTHPRLRGPRSGRRPCRTSTDDEWRGVTQNWMRHRFVSYTIVRVAIVAVIAFFVAGIFHPIPQPISSVLTGAAAVVIAFIVNRVAAIATLSQNPPLRVGDVVILAEEYGTGVENRPEYYVVDVAVEGVQLLELEAGLPKGPGERTHDRTLDMGDVNRLLRVRTAFTGCAKECSRVNKYCPMNKGESTGPIGDSK